MYLNPIEINDILRTSTAKYQENFGNPQEYNVNPEEIIEHINRNSNRSKIDQNSNEMYGTTEENHENAQEINQEIELDPYEIK